MVSFTATLDLFIKNVYPDELQESCLLQRVLLWVKPFCFVVLDAKARIIDIMNATLSLPRTDHRDNRPIIEKLEVPVLKRSRFVGLGGLNLKKLMAETGECAVLMLLLIFLKANS